MLHAMHNDAASAGNPIEVGSCGGPTVPLFPAPWKLRGNGLILLTRVPLANLIDAASIPTAVRSSLKAPLNVVMLVNYTHSDCGPYQELLFIPGTSKMGEKRYPTISNIYVSSETSVVNGRLNWGIPKYRCNFEWIRQPNGSTRISANQNGAPFFDITHESSGLSFPINTRWAPRFLKTLGQEWDGRRFIFSPIAKGQARRAKIRDLNVVPGAFPVISGEHIVAAFEITDFEMEFPVPQIL